MAYSAAGKSLALGGVAAGARWLSLHTADPGTTGASPVAGSRVQTTWDPFDTDHVDGSVVEIAVAAGVTVTHWGLWTAEVGGSFVAGGALPAAEAFAGAGAYALTPRLSA